VIKQKKISGFNILNNITARQVERIPPASLVFIY